MPSSAAGVLVRIPPVLSCQVLPNTSRLVNAAVQARSAWRAR